MKRAKIKNTFPADSLLVTSSSIFSILTDCIIIVWESSVKMWLFTVFISV